MSAIAARGGRGVGVGVTVAIGRGTLEGKGRWWAVSVNEQDRTKRGSGRSDLKRFPYEPRMVAGKLIMPAGLQRLHQFMLENEVIATIPNDLRAVVERVWPELVPKLPRGEREE